MRERTDGPAAAVVERVQVKPGAVGEPALAVVAGGIAADGHREYPPGTAPSGQARDRRRGGRIGRKRMAAHEDERRHERLSATAVRHMR